MWDHYSVPTYIKFLKHSLDLIQELSHQHLTPQPQIKEQEDGISHWNMKERRDWIETWRREGFINTQWPQLASSPHTWWVQTLGCTSEAPASARCTHLHQALSDPDWWWKQNLGWVSVKGEGDERKWLREHRELFERKRDRMKKVEQACLLT